MTDIHDPQVAEFSDWLDGKKTPASDSYLSDCVQDEHLERAAEVSSFWKVSEYKVTDGENEWSEYAVDDRDGRPVCDGILSRQLADRIAMLPLKEQMAEATPEAHVSSHDVLVNIAQLLTELLAETKHLRAALGSSSRSSVELAENAKGGVQITTKAYVDSPMDEACVEAVAAFRTLKQEVERGQLEQWGSTVDALQNGTLR